VSMRILLVDDHAEIRRALGALLSASIAGASIAEGAAGYVAKGSAPAVIVEAVRAALPRAQ